MEAARARNGAPLPGRLPSFLRAPSIGVFGFVPVWARSILSDRRIPSASFVITFSYE